MAATTPSKTRLDGRLSPYDFPMNTEQLKELQAPLKAKYRETPDAAVITLKADGTLGDGITCRVQTGKALTAAGLHPATGGNGLSACSGDMLLEALVACAGGTLGAAGAVRDALSRAGLAGNEPVHVRISNQPLDLAAYAGVWLAGGVVVPVHRSSPPGAVTHVAAKTRARFEWDRFLNVISNAPPPPRPILDDAALIVFTSGSSGMPKGAVLSHRAFMGKLEAIQSLLSFGESDRTLLVLNITFSFGIWVALLTLLNGGCLLPREKFAANGFLQDLEDERATRVAVVPTMMRSLILDVAAAELEAPGCRLAAAGA